MALGLGTRESCGGVSECCCVIPDLYSDVLGGECCRLRESIAVGCCAAHRCSASRRVELDAIRCAQSATSPILSGLSLVCECGMSPGTGRTASCGRQGGLVGTVAQVRTLDAPLCQSRLIRDVVLTRVQSASAGPPSPKIGLFLSSPIGSLESCPASLARVLHPPSLSCCLPVFVFAAVALGPLARLSLSITVINPESTPVSEPHCGRCTTVNGPAPSHSPV